jgi:hypothetical protein
MRKVKKKEKREENCLAFLTLGKTELASLVSISSKLVVDQAKSEYVVI